MKTIKKLSVSTLLIVLISTIAVLAIVACADDGDGGDTSYDYVCANGTPESGKVDTADTNKCSTCNDGFILDSDNACVTAYDYVCAKGTPADGQTATENTTKCTDCNDGFALDSNEACVTAHDYVCENGTKADGKSATENTNRCKDCNTGYELIDAACIVEGTTTTYDYVCENGTPTEGMSATDGTTNCASCNDGYRKDGVACALNRYICDNGTAVTATDIDKPNSDETIQKCTGCTTGYLLNDAQQCEAQLTIVEQVALASTAGTTSAAVTITASKEAAVRWVVYADNSNPPADAAALINAAEGSDAGVARSGTDPTVTTTPTSDGVVLQFSVDNLSAGTDYDLYVALTTTTGVTTEQVLSEMLDISTAMLETPEFDGLIMVTTTQTTATLTINAKDNDDTSLELYWVLYATSQDKDAQQIIDDAQGNGGLQRDSTDTIATGTQKQLVITELTPQQTYYFYAVIDDDDSTTPAVRSAPVTITTTGYPYICDGGTPAGGMVATENTTKCTNCNPGFTKDGDSCNADVLGIWEIDTQNDFSTQLACIVTFLADGSVVWEGACTGYSPINSYDTYEIDGISLIFNKSSGQGHGIQHDFTVDRDDTTGVITINPHSTTLGDNPLYLRSYIPVDLLGSWEIDTQNDFSTSIACLVTFHSDGSVVWEGACSGYSPIDSYDSYEVAINSLIFNKTSGQGKGIQHDFTIDRDDTTGVFTLNPHSSTLSDNLYLRSHTPPAITTLEISGTIGATSGSFAVTSAIDSTLYWVVYTDDTTAPSAAQLIADSSDANAGAARSDGGSSISPDNPITFTASDLMQGTDYDLYVVLETTYKGVTQRVVQTLDFATIFVYACDNGTPVSGEAPAADLTSCASCDSGYTPIDGTDGNKVCDEGHPYVCQHGKADTSAASPTENVNRCTECDPGFTLGSFSGGCGRQIDLQSNNDEVDGIWSDGTTMWVVDDTDLKIYAYTLATGARDTAKEFDLATDNDKPASIWSDGTTMWVFEYDAFNNDTKLYAYTLADGTQDTTKEFDLATDNDQPRGMWSDGTTLWVVDILDSKLYAYTLANGTQDTAKDITLDAENVDARNITGTSDGTTIWVSDNEDRKLYAYTVAHCIDSDTSTPCRDTTNDIDVDSATQPRFGIWTDGTTLWVADLFADIVYAYSIAQCTDGNDTTPCSDTAKDLALDTTNGGAHGTWTDGTTIWVADRFDAKLYAYTLATGARDMTQEIDLHADNDRAYGIWSDGTTIWVVQNNFGAGAVDKVFAYTLATGERVESKEFDFDSASKNPHGIWSDGTTMWVADFSTTYTFAYTLDNGMRDTSNEFTHNALFTGGVWSDGTTMWFIHNSSGTKWVYAYALPSGDSDTATVRPRDMDKEFRLGAIPYTLHGLTSDGNTFWVTDQTGDILRVY